MSKKTGFNIAKDFLAAILKSRKPKRTSVLVGCDSLAIASLIATESRHVPGVVCCYVNGNLDEEIEKLKIRYETATSHNKACHKMYQERIRNFRESLLRIAQYNPERLREMIVTRMPFRPCKTWRKTPYPSIRKPAPFERTFLMIPDELEGEIRCAFMESDLGGSNFSTVDDTARMCIQRVIGRRGIGKYKFAFLWPAVRVTLLPDTSEERVFSYDIQDLIRPV